MDVVSSSNFAMNNRAINLKVIKIEYQVPNVLFSNNLNIKKRENVKKVMNFPVKIRKKIPDIILKKINPSSPQMLIEQLLSEIYGYGRRTPENGDSKFKFSDSERCTSASMVSDYNDYCGMRECDLITLSNEDLLALTLQLKKKIVQLGGLLSKRLCQRDSLKRRCKRICNIFTEILMKIHKEGDEDMRFSVSPRGGASGWNEWLKAMKLVARLPTGIPPEFRKKLWLTLAEQHLKVKGVDWTKAEKICFSEWTNPDDTELGVQIVKDLHRTGCSLFCGSEGRENQAVLKRVLLAYARWNKAVGYCQGFNMLAALILEVMDRSESDSLKVMIYLIEAVLPESYFANNLRGLSVDMAVFRDLLKLRLPKLSNHLDKLQKGAAEGSSYEPPLTNVFTMQWFLTLFCNCLPRITVLRVWDLIFLEGDEVLLTTALAIWDTLQDRILVVESADEFYSVMGELARQTLEAPPSSTEALLTRSAQLGPVPELSRLRDKHRYNITPWAHSVSSVQNAAKKGLRLFYSEDETDSSDEGDKLAITTAYGFSTGGRGRGALVAAGVFGHPDREKLALDISALKQQYARLRERQRQAHIILAAACARQPSVGVSSGPGPISVNHLLLGKSAIVSSRGRRLGPPQGAIPPSRVKTSKSSKASPSTQTKNETLSWKDETNKKAISRRDSIKWKDIKQTSVQNDDEEEDPEEDGKLVSEVESNEIMQTSMRTRRKSESSSYSECSESSTSTSLCDEPNRMSDFDSEPASSSDNVLCAIDETFINDINNDKLNKSVIDSKTDSDKIDAPNINENNEEFENYIQEFEDLLDRTNNFEDDNNSKIDASISSEQEETLPEHKSEDKPISPTKEAETKFVEFVDSSRGEPLRNYLNEFKKADIKHEKISEPLESPSSGILDINLSSIDDEKFDRNDDSKNVDNISLQDVSEISQNTDIQKYSDGPDETSTKPFVFPDYHSTSCERSISSSISSISPVLKCLSGGGLEDSPSYMCYKSPTRADSELGSDFSEDEKPIVLKIDKYFEHSPEFFGARKSGPCISSDEEDEPKIRKPKLVYSPLVPKKSTENILKVNERDKMTDLPNTVDTTEMEYSSKNMITDKNLDIDETENDLHKYMTERVLDIDETKKILDIDETKMTFDIDEIKTISNIDELKTNIDVVEDINVVDNAFNLESKHEKPLSLSETSVLNKIQSPIAEDFIRNADKTVKSPDTSEKSSESIRLNILEKTKSEELPREQRRPFSLLDDEIEAIRSQSGRRNSERALKIIQENSKILHRILINQVNKVNVRDSFQEEASESLSEDGSNKEKNLKELNLYQYKISKTLSSPRSASLDDNWPRKKSFTFIPDSTSNELDKSIINAALRSPLTPVKPITPNKSITDDSPTQIKFTPKGDDKVTTPLSSLKSHISTDNIIDISFTEKNSLKEKENIIEAVDENKTDMFGWENKGFGVNQRLTNLKSDLMSPPKSYSHDVLSKFIDSKGIFGYDINEKSEQRRSSFPIKTSGSSNKIKYSSDKLELHLNPVNSNLSISSDLEKDSTLTAVSDAVAVPTDYSNQDYTDSWKIENNNSLSESYNLSSPYKFTYRSTENSGYIEGTLKHLQKFNDSPLSRVSDTFSRVTECSPLDNNIRVDSLRFENSQSSDLCIVSSSMSFSFDPSVDEQPSSKPTTFNSSDTLCQLTSLDQVSTPISPKVTTYPSNKDFTGVSQKDLSLELDKFRLTSDELSLTQGSYTDQDSICISSLRSPTSPSSNQDRTNSLKSPEKLYNPFPIRTTTRQPKELGLRLGLYKDPLKSPSK